jgi:hypothetical protein
MHAEFWFRNIWRRATKTEKQNIWPEVNALDMNLQGAGN